MPTVTIPPLLARVYSHFPLVTYDAPPVPNPTPSAPTLWLLGPPSPALPSNESLDPTSRFAQTWARFNGHKGVDLKWKSSSAGAPGATLPALHLPNGELLGEGEVAEWLAKGPASSGPAAAAAAKEGSDTSSATEPKNSQDPTHEAFHALLRTTLLPAVLSALCLASPAPARSVIPHPPLPLLSSWVASHAASSNRKAKVDEITKLRAKKVAVKKAVLDLEEVERDGVETIKAVEEKFKTDGVKPKDWFAGASTPTELDAWIYTLASIILLTPSSALRDELDRSSTLLAWVKQHEL